jgi:hypothetical protein
LFKDSKLIHKELSGVTNQQKPLILPLVDLMTIAWLRIGFENGMVMGII